MAALIVAYLAADALGDPSGTFLSVALWQITHNQVVDFVRGFPAIALAIHFIAGMGWAVVYASVFEPRLGGAGWQRGMLFSLIPWAASLLALVPAAMVGHLNTLLSAGVWLPPIGNLILHLIYGGTLGALYDRSAEQVDTADRVRDGEVAVSEDVAAHAEGFAAAGIISGVVVGAFVGVGLAFALPTQTASDGTTGWPIGLAVGGLLAGGAVGAVIGSFAGLPQFQSESEEPTLGADVVERNILAFLVPIGLLLVIAFAIVGFGSFLLTSLHATNNKLVPVAVSTVAAFAIAAVGWLTDSRLGSRRTAAGHETPTLRGH
jgi:hypothetical protein